VSVAENKSFVHVLTPLSFLFSGQQLLCIPPTPEPDGFHSVKWHPKQPDMLAVASQTTIYLIDLVDAARIWRGQPMSHNDLSRISQLFSVASVRC
jgi:hypothetical protein